MSDDDIFCVKTNQPTSWREREYQGVSRVAVFNSMVSRGLSGWVTVERGSGGEPCGDVGGMGGLVSRFRELPAWGPSGGRLTWASV